MKTYKIEINKKELLKALSDYYSKLKNTNIIVKETHNTGYSGIYEEKVAQVKIYYEQPIEILGHTATETVDISLEDIKAIINEDLNEKGFTVNSITYKSGIRQAEYFAYSYDEVYFDGIELQITEKQKTLSYK